MNKKGLGLAINIIVIAVLALLVLTVLWAIFTGRMGAFNVRLRESDENIRCTDNIIYGQKITLTENIKECPQGKTKIPGKFADIEEGKELCCTK